jgi:endonuclease/exonuclease/phosphatase family metal-dependent hydrolase
VWLVATLTVAALEMVRASGPLLDRAFATGTLTAILTALGTYGASGLVAVLVLLVARCRSGIPNPRAVLVAASVLAVSRLAAQAAVGDLLFWVGLVTVALAVTALTLAVAFVAGRPAGGRQAAIGLLLGCALSVGLQMSLGTWDSLWRDDWSGWVVALVIALAPLLTARSLMSGHGGAAPATGRPRRLWALGPFLALAAMILANPAFTASQTGIALGIAGLALVLAHTVGVWQLLSPQTWPGSVRVLAAALVVAGAAGTMWFTGALSLISLVVLVVAVGVVITGTLTMHIPAARGALRTGGATAVAGLGTIVPLALYMLDYDIPLPVDNAWVVVGAAVVLALTGLRRRAPSAASSDNAAVAGGAVPGSSAVSGSFAASGPASGASTAAGSPAGSGSSAAVGSTAALGSSASTGSSGSSGSSSSSSGSSERMPARVNTVRMLLGPAVVLALVGLVPYGTSTTGQDVPARAPGDTLTVVTWNVHYGVSPSSQVDLEGIASTIAAQGADVVALQEVSRGWILGGGVDAATWLARRLGMTIRFAPAADRQFGNAVLSRSALADTAIHELPYGAGPQERSALSTTVVTSDGTAVRVTSVHLQHREENTPTRLDQLSTLLAAEPVTGPALLAGDLNAQPGWPEIELLEDAGWSSALDAAGDPASLTSPSTDPDARIDWIFGQGVAFEDARVLTTPRESDHLPVLTQATPTS